MGNIKGIRSIYKAWILTRINYALIQTILLVTLITFEYYGIESGANFGLGRFIVMATFILLITKLFYLKKPYGLILFITLLGLMMSFNDVFIGLLWHLTNSNQLISFYLFGGGQMVVSLTAFAFLIWSFFISQKPNDKLFKKARPNP